MHWLLCRVRLHENHQNHNLESHCACLASVWEHLSACIAVMICRASVTSCASVASVACAAMTWGFQVQLCLAVLFYLESKTDESKSGRSHDSKSVICFNKALEQLGEAQVMLKVLLQALLAVGAQHKPHLQRSEAPAQRYLPVLHQYRGHLQNL